MSDPNSNENTEAVESFDVVVVGGGPAGLSAGTALARSLRSVAVLDDDRPRNGPATGAHNVLGHEGIAPRDLLAAGRAEFTGYGGVVRADTAHTVTSADDGFRLGLASGGELHARRLILATGLIDELPDIPGVADLWGTDVLHCPYCHGWEVRGQRIAVLATGPMAGHQAKLFRQLSDTVMVVGGDHQSLDETEAAELAALGIEVIGPAAREVRVRTDPDGRARLAGIALDDGRVLDADAVVVGPRFIARTDLYEQLGGVPTPHPMGVFIETDQMGATAVPGVWAAGNSADLSAIVAVSMGAGVMTGAAVNLDLITEDTQRALAATAALS
ncbi:NAD(P)/FAD-dependent oxidoreductase [Gordonia sp. ABSL1-1]|uniref:NAD(P)/FAD-dependent oxidoreductase n=1 Tax=Gordonia sp. ABSL1-1 TaxID=3053923 RepID=UPI0025725CEB|nr:NAD(P)/FAD-dependent oxidoreductase [Gordonia sp. ABSL1-1]MDL9936906.1 NAD(P)/FAD-dependent oxidoreductase [Gordonia sp. ABSL1-1]